MAAFMNFYFFLHNHFLLLEIKWTVEIWIPWHPQCILQSSCQLLLFPESVHYLVIRYSKVLVVCLNNLLLDI